MLAQSPPPPSIPCASEYTGNPAEATVRGCNIRCRQGFYKSQRKQPNPCSSLQAPRQLLGQGRGAATHALKGGCDWVDQDGANPTAVPPPYVVTPPTTPSGSHPGANATAYLLFDLDSDPTESSPANAASPELVRKYTGILRHFVAGLRRSQVNESKCLGPDD